MLTDKQGLFGFSLVILIVTCGLAGAGEVPSIFPIPRLVKLTGGDFFVDESTRILLPPDPGDPDRFLGRLLVAEFADLFLTPIRLEQWADLPSEEKYILMGSRSNDLVRRFIESNRLSGVLNDLGEEGYILRVGGNAAVVAANTDRGAMYGFQSMRQLIGRRGERIAISNVLVEDTPLMPFRGIRMFIPGHENIPFFKRFIRDFMALYKFNKIVLEVNGVMRLDRHPEINVGSLEFAREMNYSRRGRPEGPGNQFQNSAHHDAGDGQILEKEEVAELVNYIRRFHIEVIPEIPSLTHSYYLLARHRDLAEIKDAEWPDTYCPSNPHSYELLFDVFDEYIEVIQPDMIHVGKDEWRMPVDVCTLCKGKDYRELFVQDVLRITDYMEKKGVKVCMWGDHLLESVRERGYRERTSSSGYEYKIPGAVTPEQVRQDIPKDILIFNWFWGEQKNDQALIDFGFQQVYGNMRPNISSWRERISRPGVLGGAPSSWAATTELNFGKDLLYDYLGCANLLWSEHHLEHDKLAVAVRSLLPAVRRYLRGENMPGEEDNPIVSIDISGHMNVTGETDLYGIKLGELGNTGEGDFLMVDPVSSRSKIAIAVSANGKGDNLVTQVNDIKIDRDASSLIFLHACAREAGNEKSYRAIYDFEDTADLLGYYEIVYADGYVMTIPIRYGVNILDVDMQTRDRDQWEEGRTGAPQNVYSYLADPVECSLTDVSRSFFSFEWKNPRLGKKIDRINLNGVYNFRNTSDRGIPENAVLLLAINCVEKRPGPENE